MVILDEYHYMRTCHWPQTLLGKFVASLCTLCGVFILKLPIPIIVNSFSTLYDTRMWRTEVDAKKKMYILNKAEKAKEAERMRKKKEIIMVRFYNTILQSNL